MNQYNLISETTFKTQLGLDPNKPTTGPVEMALQSASLTVQHLMGRNLTLNSYTEYYDSKINFSIGYDLRGLSYSGRSYSPKPCIISLKNYPVDLTQSFQVMYDTTGQFIDPSLVLDPSAYSVDPGTGLLSLFIDTFNIPRCIQVTYSAGYASSTNDNGEVSLEGTLPPDLQQATAYQALHVFSKQSTTNLNATAPRTEGKTRTAGYVNMAGIAPETMAICAMNKRPRIAVI